MIIDNASSKKFTQLNTLSTWCKRKRKDTSKKCMIIDNTSSKKFTQLNTLAMWCKRKRKDTSKKMNDN